MPKFNPYDVLGLGPNATEAEIKKAYRQRVLKHHPDRVSSPGAKQEATERFKDIQRAYEILKDPATKERYDRFGITGESDAGVGGAHMPSANDFLDPFFHNLFGRHGININFHQKRPSRRQGAPVPPKDQEVGIDITTKYLMTGGKKTFKISRKTVCRHCKGRQVKPDVTDSDIECGACGGTGTQVLRPHPMQMLQIPCQQCGGTGQRVPDEYKCPQCSATGYQVIHENLTVQIPEGCPDKKRIVLNEKGDMDANLIFVINERFDEGCSREGPHYVSQVTIDIWSALRAQFIQVHHPTRGAVSVRLKEAEIINPDATYCLKGFGYPTGDGDHGDWILRFKIKFPAKCPKDIYAILANHTERDRGDWEIRKN